MSGANLWAGVELAFTLDALAGEVADWVESTGHRSVVRDELVVTEKGAARCGWSSDTWSTASRRAQEAADRVFTGVSVGREWAGEVA